MGNDPFPPHYSPRTTGHIDPFGSRWDQAPQPCGRPMTQHGSVPRRKDSGHPPPPLADPAHAEHEDSSVHFMQLSSLQAPVDGPAAHPKTEQLPSSHHRMLPLGKL